MVSYTMAHTPSESTAQSQSPETTGLGCGSSGAHVMPESFETQDGLGLPKPPWLHASTTPLAAAVMEVSASPPAPTRTLVKVQPSPTPVVGAWPPGVEGELDEQPARTEAARRRATGTRTRDEPARPSNTAGRESGGNGRGQRRQRGAGRDGADAEAGLGADGELAVWVDAAAVHRVGGEEGVAVEVGGLDVGVRQDEVAGLQDADAGLDHAADHAGDAGGGRPRGGGGAGGPGAAPPPLAGDSVAPPRGG